MLPFEESDRNQEGIILRMTPYSDADLILTVLTRAGGKQSFLAKNARGSSRRLGSSLDLFDRGRFELKKGRGPLPIVSSFVNGSAFRTLRDDLEKMTAASLLCESYDVLIQETPDLEPEHFESLTADLKRIDAAPTTRELLRFTFEALLVLLSRSGYLDTTNPPVATPKNFLTLMNHIERCAERDLRTKPIMTQIVESAAPGRTGDDG